MRGTKRNFLYFALALLLLCASLFVGGIAVRADDAPAPVAVEVQEEAASPEATAVEESAPATGEAPAMGDVAATDELVADQTPAEEDTQATDVPADVPTEVPAADAEDAADEAAAVEEDPAAPVQEEVLVAEDVQEELDAAAPAEEEVLVAETVEEELATAPVSSTKGISYTTHVQNIGWQDPVSNGTMAGTEGLAYRLESIRISVAGMGYSGGIRYRTHVQNEGDQSWVYNGAESGSTGKAQRLEAIWIELTGDLAKNYDVEYRVHVQNIGWQDWVKNGQKAGTSGQALRLEGINIRLVEKPKGLVSYNAHVQNYGDQNFVSDGASAGRPGEGLRLEAIRIRLGNGLTGSIKYRAHVQNIGWRDWSKDGAMSGSTGMAYRVEALMVELEGNVAKTYDVYYRTYVQGYGWLAWAKNGEPSGSEGKALRIEGLQVKLVKKNGGTVPTSSSKTPFLKETYIYLDAGHGWGSSYIGVLDTGATGVIDPKTKKQYLEYELTHELAQLVAKYAKEKYGLNVYVNIASEGNPASQVTFRNRQADAARRGATMFVSIHFNAFTTLTATGSETYIHSLRAAPRSSELQKIMHSHLIAGMGITDRGMHSEEFAVCGGSVPATLLEVCFITNPHDMETYQKNKDKVAQELALGLYEASKAGF